MEHSNKFTNNTKIYLLLIIIVASILRLTLPTLVDFWGDDERRDYHQVIRMLDGEDFPVNGPTVFPYGDQGHIPGGFFYYLNAIPYSISRHPAMGTIFLNVLNIFGVVIIYILAKKMFGEKIALLSALLISVSPWAILFGRKFMHHYFGIFFVALLLYLIWRWIKDEKHFHLLVILPILAVLIQIHLIFVSVALFFILLLILSRPKIKVGYLLAGVGIAILTYLPFILVDAGVGFETIKVFLDFRNFESTNNGKSADFIKSITHPLLMGSNEISYFIKDLSLKFYSFPALFFYMSITTVGVFILAEIASIIYMIKYILRYIKENGFGKIKEDNKALGYLILLLLLFSFILINILRLTIPHPKYFAPLVIIMPIFTAVFFGSVLPKSRAGVFRFMNNISSIIIAFIIIMNIFTISQYLFAKNIGIVFNGMGKIPVRYYLEAAEYIIEDSHSNYNIVDERAVVWSEHLGAVYPITTFMTDYYNISPQTNEETSEYKLFIDFESENPPIKYFKESRGYKKFSGIYIFKLKDSDDRK